MWVSVGLSDALLIAVSFTALALMVLTVYASYTKPGAVSGRNSGRKRRRLGQSAGPRFCSEISPRQMVR